MLLGVSWDISWALLGGLLGRLGGLLAVPGAFWGSFFLWGLLGPLGGRLGGLLGAFLRDHPQGVCWSILGLSASVRELCGSTSGHRGRATPTSLETTWNRVGPSWVRLEAVLGLLGPSWAVSGPSRSFLGLSHRLLDRSWTILGLSWDLLERAGQHSWGLLKPSGGEKVQNQQTCWEASCIFPSRVCIYDFALAF